MAGSDAAVRSRLATGAAAGVGAWLAGLALTLAVVLVVGADANVPANGSDLAVDGGDLSVLGLLYFGAHLVDTVLVPPLTDGFNLVTQLAEAVDPLYRVLFLVPPVVLALGGAAVVVVDGSPLAGPLVTVGYLPATVAGAVGFRVAIGTGPVSVVLQPPTTPAVVLAGVAYPLSLGLLGGLAAALVDRTDSGATRSA